MTLDNEAVVRIGTFMVVKALAVGVEAGVDELEDGVETTKLKPHGGVTPAGNELGIVIVAVGVHEDEIVEVELADVDELLLVLVFSLVLVLEPTTTLMPQGILNPDDGKAEAIVIVVVGVHWVTTLTPHKGVMPLGNL